MQPLVLALLILAPVMVIFKSLLEALGRCLLFKLLQPCGQIY
jgi:hypothetical protein